MIKILIFISMILIFSGCSFQQVFLDADMDGVYNHKDICPNTPKYAQVDSFGCALDSDLDGVIDLYDICPKTPLSDIVDSRGCSK